MRSLLIVASLCSLMPAQGSSDPGRVTKVTLYRGQALVTREIPLPSGTGALEITVPGMPHTIQQGSLFAEGDDNVDVRAVRYRQRAVGEEPREEVRKIDSRMAEIEDALAANTAAQQTLQSREATLDRLDAFVAPTAHHDLAKGTLDAEALQKIITFGFEQRKEVHEEKLQLGREAKKLQEELSLLQRQRQELQSSSQKVVREAVVFLEKRQAGAANLQLSYIVSNCGWTPTYNLRANRGAGTVQLEYNALIQQTSGEDWSDVAFTLSTATPALSAAGPGLAPFKVAMTAGGRAPQGATKAAAAQYIASLSRQQMSANVQLQNAIQLTDNLNTSWALNCFANDSQAFELATEVSVLNAVSAERTTTAPDGPSLSYEIDGTISLASRTDQQMVRIARDDLTSTFQLVATPVLTSLVYREAAVQNTSTRDFLSGPVNVYLANRFVGRAEMPNVARGEGFVIGLGADPRLKAGRELVDKTEKVQGGNRLIQLSYRLQIENFREEAVDIQLLDRLPITDNSRALRVQLGDVSTELSKDALYVRTDRPLGILRWDIKVAAGATRENAHEVTYDYTLEFERGLAISNPASPQNESMKAQFEQLLRTRGAR